MTAALSFLSLLSTGGNAQPCYCSWNSLASNLMLLEAALCCSHPTSLLTTSTVAASSVTRWFSCVMFTNFWEPTCWSSQKWATDNEFAKWGKKEIVRWIIWPKSELWDVPSRTASGTWASLHSGRILCLQVWSVLLRLTQNMHHFSREKNENYFTG